MSLRDLGRRCMAGPQESGESDLTKRAREVLAGLDMADALLLGRIIGDEPVDERDYNAAALRSMCRDELLDREQGRDALFYTIAPLGREVARLISERSAEVTP